MRNRTFAIIGGTLWGNRGAEAMVVTSMARVRDFEPDARFLLLSYYPGADRRLAAGKVAHVDNAKPQVLLLLHFPFALLCWFFRLLRIRVPDALLPGPVRRLRACAALLDVSGISFHDGRLAIVAYNVFCIWPALLLGVPVFHLSQAMGPFENTVNRLSARWFLSACRHSFARGRITADFMKPLGLPADRWSLAADVAFSFRDGDSITVENPDRVSALCDRLAAWRAEGRTVVALSPSSVVLGKTQEKGIPYVELLAREMARLHSLGHRVLVLPNATRAGGEGARNNDFFVIDLLRQAAERLGGVDAGAVAWVDFDLNTDSIRALIRQCDLLVTSRFHAMVAGLSVGTPTFVIGWSHKYEEVLEMFGCQDDAIDFAAMESELGPLVDAMLARREEKRALLAKHYPAVAASSGRQFELVRDQLG